MDTQLGLGLGLKKKQLLANGKGAAPALVTYMLEHSLPHFFLL